MAKRVTWPETGETVEIPDEQYEGAIQSGYQDAADTAEAVDEESVLAPKPTLMERATKPLVSKDAILRSVTGGKTKGYGAKDVEYLRDSDATEEELQNVQDIEKKGSYNPITSPLGLDTKVGRRKAIAGVAESAADVLSGMSNPVTLALGAAGKAAQGASTVAKAVRTGLTGAGIYGGVKGAERVGNAVAEGKETGYTPEVIEDVLTDGSDVAGLAATTGAMGRGVRRAYRQKIKGVDNPKLQEAAMTTAVGPKNDQNVREDLVRPVIDDVRNMAKRMGFKPKDFHGEDGIKKFKTVLRRTSAEHEAEFKKALSPFRTQKPDTQIIADRLRARLKDSDVNANPDLKKALETQAKEFDRRGPKGKLKPRQTVEHWNSRRRVLNETSDAIYQSQAAGKSTDVMPGKAKGEAAKYAADEIRTFIYDEIIGRAGAYDPKYIRSIKNKEGKIAELRRLLDKKANKVSNEQAEFESTGPQGEAEQTGKSAISFGLRALLARTVLSRFFSPETVETSGIKKAFAGVNEKPLKPPSYKGDPFSTPGDVGAAAFLQSIGEEVSDDRDDNIPDHALGALREGVLTRFANGTAWTIVDGKPVQVE